LEANTIAKKGFSVSATSVTRLEARCAADLPADSVDRSLCALVLTEDALGLYRRDTPRRVAAGSFAPLARVAIRGAIRRTRHQ